MEAAQQDVAAWRPGWRATCRDGAAYGFAGTDLLLA